MCVHVFPSAEEDNFGEPLAPEITHPLQGLEAQDGSLARFECRIHGNPMPSITWFHESTVIAPSPDFLQFYDEDNLCSLIIKEVFPEDTGRYTVVAKNHLGTATSSAELVVFEGMDGTEPAMGLRCS